MDNLEEELIQAICDIESLDAISSYKIEIKHQPLVSILMTTFNVEKYIVEAIDSVFNQTYINLELIIVDDASTDNTVELIKNINDPRIRLFKNKTNCGTYYSKNYGLTKSQGKYIAIQDSDDISDKNRIKKQVDFLESYENKQFVVCQYTRFDKEGNHLIAPRLAFQSSMIRKSVFDDLGFYDTVRVAADDEFNARMMQFYGSGARGVIEELLYFNRSREDSLTSTIEIGSSPRTTYVENYKKWHSSISNKSNLYIDFPLKSRPFPVEEKIEVNYNPNLEPINNIEEIAVIGNKVTGSMVSIPSRELVLGTVIDSILPQVDELNVYLNNYEQIPDFLKNPKIKVFQSQIHGDLADNGKFFSPPQSGFHFTFDDDILYPLDYISKLIENLKKYQCKVAVGVHGIEIKEGFKRYYDIASREVISFYRESLEDRYVHILGTGTLAYHTQTLSFSLEHVHATHMVDIYFGLFCQKNNIPLICIEHEAKWMKELETPKETRIFDNFSSKDKVQTDLVKSIKWSFKYHALDVKENLDLNLSIEERMLRKLEDFGERLIENERTIVNQKRTIEKYQNDLAWYSRTYDHLPKWFLKIGGIFRRI